MAQEDDLDLGGDGGAAAKPKSKAKLLVIGSVVVLLLGVSAATTLLVTGMLSQDQDESVAEDTGSGKKADKAKAKAPLNYVPMDPPFVVNFNADTDVQFLQISLEVGTRDPDAVDLIKEHRPAIRNSLVMLFGNQDPGALNSREGKEKLRDETLSEIQKVMQEETGDAGVDSVFFTSFVMQ